MTIIWEIHTHLSKIIVYQLHHFLSFFHSYLPLTFLKYSYITLSNASGKFSQENKTQLDTK